MKRVGDKLKVRIVLDAKAEFKGKSLNDFILTGPKVSNDIDEVLLKFRLKKVAFTADISEMFLQIKMPEEDQKYFQMIWRDKDSKRLKVLRFSSHVFGATSSPFIAMLASRMQADSFKEKFPTASHLIKHNTIVDDTLGIADSASEARKLISEIKSIFKDCNMKVHKFASNEPEALADIESEAKAKITEVQGVRELAEMARK